MMDSLPPDRRLSTESVDARIVAALERLSRVFRSRLWEKAKENPLGIALSPIQIQVLQLLDVRRTARSADVAREFELTPATVSDVVRVLGEKGLVTRVRSAADGRVQVLRLTPLGEQVAHEVRDWMDVIEHHMRAHSDAERILVLRFLLDLIESLHGAGLISVTRTCGTCRFFGKDETGDPSAPHYCHLIERPLREEDLRVDCPEHEPAG